MDRKTMFKNFIFYLVIFINTILVLILSLDEKMNNISILTNIKLSIYAIIISLIFLSIYYLLLNLVQRERSLKKYLNYILLNLYSLSIFFIFYNIFFYKYSLEIGRVAEIFIVINIILILLKEKLL